MEILAALLFESLLNRTPEGGRLRLMFLWGSFTVSPRVSGMIVL